ncbi:hypothetical protein BS78_04G019600 [Paspalum vaginatum]|nr:hypothetical protein BS78_04G019600 [Paspalum vaginatum]
MRDLREDEFMETLIREGMEEFSAQQQDEANSYPTTSPPKKNKKPRGPTKKENFEERYTITHVGDDGKPLEPVKATTKFVNFCGIIVRENVPISILAWKKAEKSKLNLKMLLELSSKFTLPQGTEEMVKQWALKEMAVLFQTFKTKLWGNYVKHGQAPDFRKYPKLRGDWELFVQYKESEAGISREDGTELEQRGVNLGTASWLQHSKCWFYGYGGSLSSDGTLSFNDKIKRAAERFVEAIDKSSKGEFIPEREKDELTWAPENREHPGRTRGLGIVLNLTTPIAHGVALPVLPGQKYHCSDIPPGYSTVSMEQVVSIYEDLELEHKGGDGERTLKEVVHEMILWSPNNNSSPQSPKSPTKPPTHRSPRPRKSSKSSQKKTSESARKKFAYEQTQEETEKAVKSYVREQLAPKPPEKRLKIDPKANHHFIKSMKPPTKPVVPSDYERQLRKAVSKHVPQLREQPQQFVPWRRHEFGKPLVSPDEFQVLPIQMRRFQTAFPANVKDNYYCHGDNKIWLDFKDIFEVYQKDMPDITLMSAWTVMEMQRCRREKITNLGFSDLGIVNK